MVAKNFDSLLRQLEQLMSQQRNWDTLNAASEKINMVYKLLENADEEDQQELRQQRERTRTLEAENAALQKRLKDADVKLGHADKKSNTALQTLAQAQQRSSEWELRAREHEGQLEMVRTQLEQAEQTHTQLEADYNITKVQLEEHQADSRLAQVSLLLRFQFILF
jgi:DNA repair exonuclease SbcCD ATPase subunit